jgi:hypothetical protein
MRGLISAVAEVADGVDAVICKGGITSAETVRLRPARPLGPR